MTAEDVWGPILSYLGTTRSRDASSGSFVKMEVSRGNRKTEDFSAQSVESFRWFFKYFYFHFGRKKDQQQWSWSAFGPGCDRALKDFMGRCHMIHWVIGFRPVLIAGRPEPKNLEGFLRVLFSAVQQNGIWSASASRHSRRPSQFLGALIQTTWRPASGYGPFTKKKKKKEI